MSNASTTVAALSRPIDIAKPIRLGEEHSQAPLAGLNRSSQKQLVKRMEDDGDDLAIWRWKPRKLVSAPFSRMRSRQVHRHPLAAAARIAFRLTLVAARLAASRAAASATKAALKTWAHRGAWAGHPQRHQVGTTSGQACWNQSGNQDDRKGRKKRSGTSWYHLRNDS
jgi:hypothetical protein